VRVRAVYCFRTNAVAIGVQHMGNAVMEASELALYVNSLVLVQKEPALFYCQSFINFSTRNKVGITF
jgi:hypothetical protein